MIEILYYLYVTAWQYFLSIWFCGGNLLIQLTFSHTYWKGYDHEDWNLSMIMSTLCWDIFGAEYVAVKVAHMYVEFAFGGLWDIVAVDYLLGGIWWKLNLALHGFYHHSARRVGMRSSLFFRGIQRLLWLVIIEQRVFWWGCKALSRRRLALVDGIGWYTFPSCSLYDLNVVYRLSLTSIEIERLELSFVVIFIFNVVEVLLYDR